MLDGCTSRVAIFLFNFFCFLQSRSSPFGYIEALPNFIGSASQGQAMYPCRDDLVPTSVFLGGQLLCYSQSGQSSTGMFSQIWLQTKCGSNFYKKNPSIVLATCLKACLEIWRLFLKLCWILAIENLKKHLISALLILLAKLRPIFLIGHQKYCFKNSLSCFAYITFVYFFVDEKLKMISTFTPDNSKKTFQKLRYYLKRTIQIISSKKQGHVKSGLLNHLIIDVSTDLWSLRLENPTKECWKHVKEPIWAF
jgi:hypothetical protein